MVKEKILRNLNTAWIQEGDPSKTILFFIHGCPDTPQTWKRQIQCFIGENYQVVAPYARGVMPSAPATNLRRYGLPSVALDHLEILHDVDPSFKKPVVVVGHDLGGMHAWTLASLLGQRLKALVLINAPTLQQMAYRLMWLRQIYKSWYIVFFQVPFLSEYFLKIWKNKGNSISPFLPHYRQAVRSLAFEFLQNRCPILAPVLVLWGKEDPFLDVPTQEELNKIGSRVTIRVLEGRHWIHEEQFEHVNQLIGDFLEKQHV